MSLTPKVLIWALGVQLVLGGFLLWQAATDFALFRDDDRAAAAPVVPVPRTNAFDAPAAMRWAERQVRLGPRPAGSAAQRRAAAFLRAALPEGRFVELDGGLRNIVGEIPGTGKPILVVAHYDTAPVDDHVGANDSAAGVGAVIELARALRRDGAAGRPVQFLLTDGEEAPDHPPAGSFYDEGLRGSKAAAQTMDPGEVIVLDFIGQEGLRLPRELGSDPELWARLRAAARRAGVERVFPRSTRPEILDDHTPFVRRGIPSIDLIDFDYDCWHKPCDTLDKLSVSSVDAAGEAVLELIRELRRSPPAAAR